MKQSVMASKAISAEWVPTVDGPREQLGIPGAAMTMTPHQTAMFEGGFAAYADGVSRELITSLPIDSASKGWALKGWDASKDANESLQRQFRRSET